MLRRDLHKKICITEWPNWFILRRRSVKPGGCENRLPLRSRTFKSYPERTVRTLLAESFCFKYVMHFLFSSFKITLQESINQCLGFDHPCQQHSKHAMNGFDLFPLTSWRFRQAFSGRQNSATFKNCYWQCTAVEIQALLHKAWIDLRKPGS